MLLRPFFYFFGGKWLQAKRYPTPEHKRIVEPFAGSAGYATRYYDREVILVEKDPLIAGLWKWLIRVSPAEIRRIPLLGADDTIDDLGNVAQEAKHLVGFRIVVAVTAPAKRPGSWMRRKLANPVHSKTNQVAWGDTFWCERVRERIATQVEYIRHWRIIEGDYTTAPTGLATWFVDSPYQGPGKSYKFHDIDYNKLASWCRGLKGQKIVCEQEGANWLEFEPMAEVKSTQGKSKEMIWTGSRSAVQNEQIRRILMITHEMKINVDAKDLNDREKKVLHVINAKGPITVEDLRKACFPGVRADDDTKYPKSTAAGNRAVRNALRRLLAGRLVQKTWLTAEGSQAKLTAFLPA